MVLNTLGVVKWDIGDEVSAEKKAVETILFIVSSLLPVRGSVAQLVERQASNRKDAKP